MRVHPVRRAEAMFVVYLRVPFISCFKLEHFVTVEFFQKCCTVFFLIRHIYARKHTYTHLYKGRDTEKGLDILLVSPTLLPSYPI